MLYSSTSITYLLISGIVLLAAAASAAVGLWIAFRWDPEGSPEVKAALEKWAYLVTTVTGVALYARLISLPIWFWTLQTLIPMVPGAMCLTGVHMAVYPISFFATGAKLLVPMVYAYWLAVHAVDRAIPSQPLFRAKLYWITPILLLLVLESALDAKILTSIRPAPVSCCTSVFDEPSTAAGRMLCEPNWWWTAVFAALCAWSIAGFRTMRKSCHPLFCGAAVISVPVTLTTFLVSLHANIGPILMNAPFHHCVFCLWQNTWSAPVFIIILVAGIWLLGVQAMVRLAGRRKAAALIADRMAGRLANLGIGLLAVGLLLMFVHLGITLGRGIQ